ncbi:MAG: haloalkane dehalogenase [Pseudomonadota bacterium]
MKVLRTPDSCFENLRAFDYDPHYLTILDDDGTELRVHYIDEGPRNAPPILLMHGNPTWTYLYRKMLPGLMATGRRVVAVDLVGLGRSDKPAKRKYYTQARHIQWMEKWLLGMDLQSITMFCQDWGGTIGLHLVANHPERFDRVIASNTGLPVGDGGTKVLRTWQNLMRFLPLFPMRMALKRSIRVERFTDKEYRSYLAPFPSFKYQAGILSFPQLIAVFPGNPGVDQNRQALEKLGQFHKPFLTLFGDRDPVTRGYERQLQKTVPGAKGQKHKHIVGGGHFIQEDRPEELVAEIVPFLSVG